MDRWSSSEDAPWAEVISAPRTMSSGQCATSHASSANAPAATSARTSEQQSVPRPYAGKGPQTMAQRVRSSTPPATGRQRLGQAMADFGQSAASRGLSPAVCGNQRGTIPAKPAQACGYSPTTTGGPSKTGGHRIDLKPATGKQMLKVKPDPPELPKDAHTDDFPSLSKREAANRWSGGATRSSSCVPPKVGGSMPCQLRPLALRQSVPLLVPRDPRSKHLGTRAHPCLKRQVLTHRMMGVRGDALPRIVKSRTLGPRFRRGRQSKVPRLACLSRRSLARQSRHLSEGAAFQMSLVGIILSQRTAPRPCRPMRRWGWLLIPKHPDPLVGMHSPHLRMQVGPKGLHPAKALWVAAMMGTAMGRREIPLPPLPMSDGPRRSYGWERDWWRWWTPSA